MEDVIIKRVSVAKIDEILGREFKVLDDGFIRVIDYMGSDESIVQAARVSYGKGTKKLNEDRGLIRYLMKHQHTSPFEMCEVKLHIRVPMDCWRQWIRHRTASVNEYSTRYSIAIESMHKTNPDEWRSQSFENRQGSGQKLQLTVGNALSLEEEKIHKQLREIYNERIKSGVAREQARKDLPLSTFTEAYWKIDLHNLLHFLKLRMDNRAQSEIREYATIIGNEIVKSWCPLTWDAFVEYQLNSISLSKTEIELIALIIRNQLDEAKTLAQREGYYSISEEKNNRNINKIEFENKLNILGIFLPWK